MFFKENSPAVVRYSVSDVQEILSILKAYDNQKYTFYLKEALVLNLWNRSSDYIQMTKKLDGEKELYISHGTIFVYKFHCVYGYSKIYDAEVYRLEKVIKYKRGEDEGSLTYKFPSVSTGYVLFDESTSK